MERQELVQFFHHPSGPCEALARRFWAIHGPVLGDNALALWTQLTMEPGELGDSVREEPAPLTGLALQKPRAGLLRNWGFHPGAHLLHGLGAGHLVSLTETGEAWLWQDGEVLRRWKLEGRPQAVFRRDGWLLVLDDRGGHSYWNAEQEASPSPSPRSGWGKPRLLPGHRVVDHDIHGTYLYDLLAEKNVQNWPVPAGEVVELVGQPALAGVWGQQLRVLEIPSGNVVEVCARERFQGILADPDGSLWVGTQGGTLEQWRAQGQSLVKLRELGSQEDQDQGTLRFAPDSDFQVVVVGRRASAITALAWDGRPGRLWAAHRDGLVGLWNLLTGCQESVWETGLREIQELHIGAEGDLREARGADGSVAFFCQGQSIGYAGQAGWGCHDLSSRRSYRLEGSCLQEWSLLAPQEEPAPWPGVVRAFSRQGHLLLTERGLYPPGHQQPVYALEGARALSQDGQWMAWSTPEGIVCQSVTGSGSQWPYAQARPLRSFPMPELCFDGQNRIWVLEQDPDRKPAVGYLVGYEAGTGKLLGQIEVAGLHLLFPRLQVHPRLPLALSWGPGGSTRVWDLARGVTEELRSLEKLKAAAFHPDQPILAVSKRDGSLGFHSLPGGASVGAESPGEMGKTPLLAFLDDRHLVWVEQERHLVIYQWREARNLGVYWSTPGPIVALCTAPEGGRLAVSGCQQNWVFDWNAQV